MSLGPGGANMKIWEAWVSDPEGEVLSRLLADISTVNAFCFRRRSNLESPLRTNRARNEGYLDPPLASLRLSTGAPTLDF